jgi:hypothetical protein
MKKIDIGQALKNPHVAKALSVFTVGMMNNIEVTNCLREAFAQDTDLKTSSKKLIQAIESYREKTIARTPPPVAPPPVAPPPVAPPPVAPPPVAPPPNKHIPKYYEDDIVLYEHIDVGKLFIAKVTNVNLTKETKPIYTIQKINSSEKPFIAQDHHLFDVATLNTKIESLRKSLKDNLTKNARTDIDNILKIHLNNHKMLVAAIKENDNFEIGFKKRDWLSDPPNKLKSIVNKKNIDVFLSVMRAARVEQLVNMITNPTEEAKSLVKQYNIYINTQKLYLNDIISEDDKKKFEDAMSFVREEGIYNAESESDPEAVIEKLLAMAEADKIIMTEEKKDKAIRLAQDKEKDDRDMEIRIRLEEMRKKEQTQKGGRRTKKTHYRKHIKTN